jgi:hypothetical protein
VIDKEKFERIAKSGTIQVLYVDGRPEMEHRGSESPLERR